MTASLIPVRKKRSLDDVATSSASTSLTDLSDELLILILENLGFRKRFVTRRVCRTLCRVAESLPPPEELRVEFFRSEEQSRITRPSRKLQSLHMWGHYIPKCNHSTTNIDILVDYQSWAEEDYLLQLRAIRPIHLKLDAFSGISSRLLHRVADQVAGRITSLSITRLKTDSPLALYDAFSPFRNACLLTHLRLKDFSSIRSVFFALNSLTSLVRLALEISARAFPEWNAASVEQARGFGLELIALQSLPNLRELSIRDHTEVIGIGHHYSGFILGCSAMHQIRVLSYDFRFDDDEEENYQAFALMLSRLENLEKLSTLCFQSEILWSHLHRAGGHSKLQSIHVYYQDVQELDLEDTVRAIVRDFPALVTLELELMDHGCVELDRTVERLVGLKRHSSMTNVSVFLEPYRAAGVNASAIDDFLRMLQKDLGPKISVTAFDAE
jgi:hypothetical protein